MPSKLTTWFPFSLPPQIISAPMLGVANARLACAVSLAGGIGFIPAGFDFSSPSSPQLVTLEDELITAQELFSSSFPSPGRRSGEDENGKERGEGGFLQIGVGFILSHPSCALFTTNVIPLLRKYKPRAIWLFAPHPDRPEGLLLEIINAIHQEGMVVFFQVGTVHEAKSTVRDGADVVVAQGVDAGGHQSKSGSGVVSLVPEVRDAVGKEVVVVGAGGVSDGRGVAGVLAAGAEAAVMGTRFLLAEEAATPPFRRELVASITDGGISTVKSTIHDAVQGTLSVWPCIYDGRALVDDTYRDHLTGVSAEENIDKYKIANDEGRIDRLVTWAGTGIGLVKEGGPAGDIVRKTREEALERIRALQQTFL